MSLVLSRKVGQSFIINGNVVVTVENVRSSNNVSISISAPRDIPIIRSELLEQVTDESHQPAHQAGAMACG